MLGVTEEDAGRPRVGLYEGHTAGDLFLFTLVQGEKAGEEEGHQASHHWGGVQFQTG